MNSWYMFMSPSPPITSHHSRQRTLSFPMPSTVNVVQRNLENIESLSSAFFKGKREVLCVFFMLHEGPPFFPPKKNNNENEDGWIILLHLPRWKKNDTYQTLGSQNNCKQQKLVPPTNKSVRNDTPPPSFQAKMVNPLRLASRSTAASWRYTVYLSTVEWDMSTHKESIQSCQKDVTSDSIRNIPEYGSIGIEKCLQ